MTNSEDCDVEVLDKDSVWPPWTTFGETPAEAKPTPLNSGICNPPHGHISERRVPEAFGYQPSGPRTDDDRCARH